MATPSALARFNTPRSPIWNPQHPLSKGLCSAFVLNGGIFGNRDLVNKLPAVGANLATTIGRGGRALAFNGTSSDLQAHAQSPLIGGAYPLSMGFLASWTTTAQCSLGGEADVSTSFPSIQILLNSGGTLGKTDGLVRNGLGGAGGQPTATIASLNNGSPNLLVIVSASATNHKLYINGVFVGSDATNNVAPLGTTANTIGRYRRSTTQLWFPGTVYAHWKWRLRALTANEVASLYSDPYAMFRPVRSKLLRSQPT